MRDQILTMYGDRQLRQSAIRHEDASIFERLLSGKDYQTILEIGTYRGCASAELAQYCKRVVTVDLIAEIDGIARHDLWTALGIRNIDLVLVKDDAEKKERIDALDFDFAFVDGNHDYESVRFDFELVKKCGRVLFHDYYPATDKRNVDGVRRFVDSIETGTVEVFRIFAMWRV